MKISATKWDGQSATDDLLVYCVIATETPTDKFLRLLDKESHGVINSLYASGEFTGKRLESSVVTLCSAGRRERVLLVGLGEKRGLNDEAVRQAGGNLSRVRSWLCARSASISLGDQHSPDRVQALVEGLLLGGYSFDRYKSTPKESRAKGPRRVKILVQSLRDVAPAERGISRGETYSEAQLLVRELAATPSNDLTPRLFCDRAQKLAKGTGLKCSILDEKGIAAERMGGLIAVAKGSVEPPRFMILEYAGGKRGSKPIVLIGKGVTFDSGGLSLKQPDQMPEMKGDMTGGAVVLSTILAASKLKLPHSIVALIPLTENMPSGTALKPGDIITLRKGVTVEITNTDAEGRLILSDALDYAGRFRPQAVIDIATLTGAAIYILGYAGAPIMGNSGKLLQLIEAASWRTAEKVWVLPIWDEMREQMKSPIADLVNSAGRTAGTIAAAAFLEKSVGDYPWAHVDIAWVDVEHKGKPYIPKGATGIGARLLTSMLAHWKSVQ